MMKIATLTAVLAGLAGVTVPRPEYGEGQVWEYHARRGDEGSLLRIQKIEQLAAFAKQGPVYHISIIGVRFRSVPLTNEVQHVPVSRQTLDASATRLSSSSAPFPDPSAGIAEWSAAEGGVFTISVAEIVGALEETVRQQNIKTQAGTPAT